MDWINYTIEETVLALRHERIKAISGLSQLPHFSPTHVAGDQVDDDGYVIHCEFDGAEHYVLPDSFKFSVGLPVLRGLLLDDANALGQFCQSFLNVYRPAAIRGELTVRLCPYEDGEGNEQYDDYAGQVGDWFHDFSRLSLPARLGWRPNSLKRLDWQDGIAMIVLQFANDIELQTKHDQDLIQACDITFPIRWEQFLGLRNNLQFARFAKQLSQKLCRALRTSGTYLIPLPDTEPERQDWELFDEDYA